MSELNRILEIMAIEPKDRRFVICGAVKDYKNQKGEVIAGVDTLIAANDKKRADKKIKERIGKKLYTLEEAQRSIKTRFASRVGLWLPKGFIVVDTDTQDDTEKVTRFIEENKINCPTFKTKKGKHFIFRLGEDKKQLVKSKTVLGAEVDYRVAGKGYVVLPLNDPNRSVLNVGEVVEIPKELLPLEEEKSVKRPRINKKMPTAKTREIQEGGRNDGLYRALCFYARTPSLRSFEVLYPVAIGLNFSQCNPPLDDEEVRNIVTSVVNSSDTFANAVSYPYFDETKDGKIKPKKVIENLNALINYLHYGVYYEAISKQFIVKKDNIETKVDSNDFISKIQSETQKHDLNLDHNTTNRYLKSIAKANGINMVLDYLLNAGEHFKQNTNGHDYIKGAFECLILDENQINVTYAYELFKLWIYTACLLPLNSLDKQYHAEGCLVLQGGQGIGKTEFSKSIVPTSLRSRFYKDSISLKFDNKDSIFEATSYWVAELGEYPKEMRRDRDEMKAFLTASSDEMRRPYQLEPETFPRYTAFIGTANDTDFLRDETGDRRSWIIPIKGIKFDELKNINHTMLWGQAFTELLAGMDAGQELWKPTRSILSETLEYNDQYRLLSNDELVVANYFKWDAPKNLWGWKKQTEVFGALPIKSSRGITKYIENHGGICKQKKVNKVNTRCCYVPPMKNAIIDKVL